MQAAFNAPAAIQAGHLDVVVAAGVESMSRVPMGSNLGVDGFAGLNEKIAARWPIVNQGISAEEIAKEWNISREELDAYALESNRRAIAAIDAGRFEREIVPVALGAGEAVRRRRGAAPRHLRREVGGAQAGFPRRRQSHRGQLEPDRRRRGGHARRQRRCSLEARARPRGRRFVSFGIAGVDPFRMLHGNPQPASRRWAGRAEWDDIAVIEVNEAFASVVLQTLADTGLQGRWESGDVNPNGGGISLGHPLGATGARITATLLAELERREARYGLACMCIGQGQAIAAVVNAAALARCGQRLRRAAATRSRYSWRACAADPGVARKGDRSALRNAAACSCPVANVARAEHQRGHERCEYEQEGDPGKGAREEHVRHRQRHARGLERARRTAHVGLRRRRYRER